MSDGQQFRFVVEDEDGSRRTLPIAPGALRVGRQADNEICLPERNVSRQHARIELSADGQAHLTDLNSYTGVFINGTRVQKEGRFTFGDSVRIGDFRLELRSVRAGGSHALDSTASLDLMGEEGTTPEGGPQAAAMAAEATAPSGATAQRLAMGHEPTVPGPITTSSMVPSEPTDPRGHAALGPDGPVGETTSLLTLRDSGMAPPREAVDQAAAELARTSVLRPRPSENKAPRPSAPPVFHLLCLSGERAGVAFPIDRPQLIIGRTHEADIALLHRSISREHSRLSVDGERVRIADLDSSNGTLVNNESYQEAELHAGDVIELGHVRLRLVAPGEPTVLTADERAAVARELRRHRSWLGGRGLVAAGAAVVALGATVAVGVWSHRPPPAAPAPPFGGALPGVDEAQSLLGQAQSALASHNFARAQALANAALAIDPSRHEAQAVAQQAQLEERSRQVLAAAQSAVQTKQWADAFNTLQEMPKDSGHQAEVDALLGEVRPQLLREREVEARQALQQQDLDEATLLVDEMEALSPNAPVLGELRPLLQAARGSGKDSKENKESKENKDGKSHVGLRAGAHKNAAPPSAALLPPGKHGLPHPSRTGGKAGHGVSEADAAKAKAAYADGTRLLAQNQAPRAIEAFGRCIAADKTFAMCYRALGIAYAKADDGPRAVYFYKQYLKIDPNARDASQVRQLLQQYTLEQSASGAGDGT